MKKIIATLLVVLTLVSCDVAQNMMGTYNMVNCKYSYNSVSNITLSGMNLSQGFSLTQLPQITSILSGSQKSIPLNFTLNLNVNNPNTSEALMNGMQYIINVDGIQFTTGSVTQSLRVASGDTKNIPLTIGLDLVSLMKGDSKDAAIGIAKNLAGIKGGKSSDVTVQIKPTFKVGTSSVVSPVYIPINFKIGG